MEKTKKIIECAFPENLRLIRALILKDGTKVININFLK